MSESNAQHLYQAMRAVDVLPAIPWEHLDYLEQRRYHLIAETFLHLQSPLGRIRMEQEIKRAQTRH